MSSHTFSKAEDATYRAYLYQERRDDFHIGIVLFARKSELYSGLYQFYTIVALMFLLLIPLFGYVVYFIRRNIQHTIDRMLLASGRMEAGEMGITVYGIITTTALVASSISNGIAQAVQPLLSANFGAGNLKRVGEARKLGVRTGFAAGFIFTAIGMLIPVQLSYLFLDPTPEILTMAVPAIRLYFLCFLVSEWNIISGMYFQSTVRPRFSLTITLLRGVS